MQQSLTSTEACGLLDRILDTINTLNGVRASLHQESTRQPEMPVTPRNTIRSGAVVQAKPRTECEVPVTPVLTIKLADLVREGDAARARRGQHSRPQRPNRPPTPRLSTRIVPPLREVRTIEVLYKRQRLAS